MEQIELMTVEQLCKILQIGKNTAYKLLQTSKIQSFKLGRSWKIPRDSVIEYIRQIRKLRIEIENGTNQVKTFGKSFSTSSVTLTK